MRIHVIGIEHHGAVFGEPIHLEQADLSDVEHCAACGEEAGQVCLGTCEGRAGVTLSLCRCAGCGHLYLGRRPSHGWYQAYYAKDWDRGRLTAATQGASGISRTGRLRAQLKRIPGASAAWRALRSARAGVRPDRDPREAQLLSMLSGLAGAADTRALPVGARLLELGCGHGGALSVFREAGFQAVGTEASEYRAEQCRERGLDVLQTPIDDVSAIASRGPFDFVYSSHVLEHLLDPAHTLGQVVPLLAEGGFVYLEVPHAFVAEAMVKLLHYPFHCHAFSMSSIVALLARLGLKPVRLQVDANLHVVAQKVGADIDFPAFPVSDDSRGLLRGEGRWLEAAGFLEIYFDDWHVRIERPGGEVIYDRARPYATRRFEPGRPSPLGRTFRVEIQKDEGEGLWPVRWIHAADRAPIWMKFQ